jgi:hypothetical protein
VPIRDLSFDRLRIYVFQRGNQFPPEKLATTPGVVDEMPADARDTGLHRGPWHLWVSRSLAEVAIFVTDGEVIQQGAYMSQIAMCL